MAIYCAKANLVLEPAYTGEGKQFLVHKTSLKASKIIPFLRIWNPYIRAMKV